MSSPVAGKIVRAAAALPFRVANLQCTTGEICLLGLNLLSEDTASSSGTPRMSPSHQDNGWTTTYPVRQRWGIFNHFFSDDLPGHLELAVKFSANSTAAEYIHQRQQVGDLVFLRPGGNVHWDPVTDPALSLMLAGGIGITPFLSMCSRLQNNVNNTTSRISLVHSSRRHFSNSSDSTLVDWPEKELNADQHTFL